MGFTESALTPLGHCKIYEDNSGKLKMAREYKYHPITKILHAKLHHFRDYVDKGGITIHKIRTEYQSLYYLTKPLDEQTHVKHRK